MSSSVPPPTEGMEAGDSGVDIKATSPLAFTVNFDNDEGDEEEEDAVQVVMEQDRRNNNNNHNHSPMHSSNKKPLNLQDGFNRFSPKHRLSSSSKSPRSPSSRPVKSSSSLKGSGSHNKKDLSAREDVGHDDDGSDTGTYTIEDEEEEEAESLPKEEEESSWNGDERISTSRDEDWISRWAEEQARQQQKIRQQQRSSGRSGGTPPSMNNNTTTLDNSDENCRFRRKLPRLPSSSNHSNDSRETEDLLKDTLSVVNAMEARIEESSTSKRGGGGAPMKPAPSSLKNERLLGAASPKKTPDPKEMAKMSELEAWKRRKNYRPTPLASAVPPKLRSSNSRISSSASEGGGRITRAALRQQSSINSTASKGGLAKKQQQQLYSKGGPNGRSTSSMSSKDAEFQAWKRRKNYNPLQAVANSKISKKKPSSGSLSHLHPGETTTTSSTPSPRHHLSSSNRVSETDFESERTLHSLQALKVSSSNSAMPPRSASFHYPAEGGHLNPSSLIHFISDEDYEEELESCDYDGSLSNSHHHQHTHVLGGNTRLRGSLLGAASKSSEQPGRKLHDLTLDSTSIRSSSTGGPHPKAAPGGGGGAFPTKSHTKLEALDNLVISTIFSVSTKLCISSQNLLQKVRTSDLELSSIIDTLLYVLDDTDPPVSPSKKTSRELSGTLRNLKKVEQVLQVLDRIHSEEDEELEGGGESSPSKY